MRTAPQAVPLETLADRAVRVIGRDKTVGTNWGGYGSFRDLLLADLPDDIHLSDTAPYTVFDGNRHISAAGLDCSAAGAAYARTPASRVACPTRLMANCANRSLCSAQPWRAQHARLLSRHRRHHFAERPLSSSRTAASLH